MCEHNWLTKVEHWLPWWAFDEYIYYRFLIIRRQGRSCFLCVLIAISITTILPKIQLTWGLGVRLAAENINDFWSKRHGQPFKYMYLISQIFIFMT